MTMNKLYDDKINFDHYYKGNFSCVGLFTKNAIMLIWHMTIII